MDEEKIRYTDKRVDESWKQAVSPDMPETKPRNQTDLSFSNFVTSLAIQALICMGDLKAPGTDKSEINLEGAKETIDLLLLLKEKTKGNLSSEEQTLMSSVIPDLQLKFVQHKPV